MLAIVVIITFAKTLFDYPSILYKNQFAFFFYFVFLFSYIGNNEL